MSDLEYFGVGKPFEPTQNKDQLFQQQILDAGSLIAQGKYTDATQKMVSCETLSLIGYTKACDTRILGIRPTEYANDQIAALDKCLAALDFSLSCNFQNRSISVPVFYWMESVQTQPIPEELQHERALASIFITLKAVDHEKHPEPTISDDSTKRIAISMWRMGIPLTDHFIRAYCGGYQQLADSRPGHGFDGKRVSSVFEEIITQHDNQFIPKYTYETRQTHRATFQKFTLPFPSDNHIERMDRLFVQLNKLTHELYQTWRENSVLINEPEFVEKRVIRDALRALVIYGEIDFQAIYEAEKQIGPPVRDINMVFSSIKEIILSALQP